MNTSVIGDRVRTLRLARNLSQTGLAAAMSLPTNSAISRIENGLSTPSNEQIQLLAQTLECTPELLTSAPPDYLVTRPWLRAYADARARTIDGVISDNVLCHEFIDALRLRRYAPATPEFTADPNDDDAIEEYADAVRAAASIESDQRVGNAVRAAERLGIIVLPMDDELGRHLGMSHFIDETPYLRVARSGIPGDRQRFTVAHEIGHLGLHAETPPPSDAAEARRIEKQAHRFAGAFLAPIAALMEDLDALGGRVTLQNLAELKGTWGVSIKGLVVRLRHHDVVSEDQATSLYKQISKRGWNTAEPVPVTNEKAVWLPSRLERRAGDLEPAQWAAKQHGLKAAYARRWVTWDEPAGTDADVVSLAGRGRPASARRAASNAAGSAVVTPLTRRRQP